MTVLPSPPDPAATHLFSVCTDLCDSMVLSEELKGNQRQIPCKDVLTRVGRWELTRVGR